jgi:hypothetical protein
MNSSRREFLETGAKLCAAAIVWTPNAPAVEAMTADATAAGAYVPFEGEKTTWHGFDRTGTASSQTVFYNLLTRN